MLDAKALRATESHANDRNIFERKPLTKLPEEAEEEQNSVDKVALFLM